MKNTPKIHKSLENLLSKSSKNVLTTAMLGASLIGASQVNADITNFSSPGLPYPPVSDGPNVNNQVGPSYNVVISDSNTCSHASGVVNGHFSVIPTVNPSYTNYGLYAHANHANHSNAHWNHSSGGWC